MSLGPNIEKNTYQHIYVLKKCYNNPNFYFMKDSNCKELLQHIGNFVKEKRQEKGISQFKLGLEVGKSANQIGRIERGESNPTVGTLYSLAKFFRVDLKEFF